MFSFDRCLAQTGAHVQQMFISSRGNLDCKWWLVDQQRVNVIEQGKEASRGAVAALGKKHYFLLWEAKLSICFNHESFDSNRDGMRQLLDQSSLVLGELYHLSTWRSCLL